MLKLDNAIDQYSKAVRPEVELRELVILDKLDEQSADKALRDYDSAIVDYVRNIIDLSNRLRYLIEPKKTNKEDLDNISSIVI